MNADQNRSSAALVIGFTIQGLAIARALSREGVTVYAIERGDESRSFSLKHPVFHSRYARFSFYESLLGEDLVEALLDVREKIPERTVVLYPASDNTVNVLASHWERLADHYVLSWSDCRHDVANIILKGALPAYCDAVGVRYPKTEVVETDRDVEACADKLQFPVLVKPNKPASSFKTHVCSNTKELLDFVRAQSENWPLVVQEWIDGPDSNLYFYTCFLAGGKECFGLAGRKVRASPPGLGRATVIETVSDPGVSEAAQILLGAFDISGPVAMEFKKDNDGKYWFIEANVGRTEYCVDLSIQAGFNIPYVEYNYALGNSLPLPSEIEESIWFDTDKEPFCYIALCLTKKTLRPHGKRLVFPYYRNENIRLQLVAVFFACRDISSRAFKKLKRAFDRGAHENP